MSHTYTPDGETVTRGDGSVGHPVIYRDTDGRIAGKAFIPADRAVTVPDYVNTSKSETVTWGELQSAAIHSDYKLDQG